jgi:hypothetical protein
MIGMLSNDVVHLHVLLDRAHSLLAAVGEGDWDTQSGPWQFAAAAWQTEFQQVRKGLSTQDSP